jgi:hypothetical protein
MNEPIDCYCIAVINVSPGTMTAVRLPAELLTLLSSDRRCLLEAPIIAPVGRLNLLEPQAIEPVAQRFHLNGGRSASQDDLQGVWNLFHLNGVGRTSACNVRI